MTQHQQNIRDFMIEAEQDCPVMPIEMDEATRILRAKLILEEAFETIEEGLGLCVYALDRPLRFNHLSFEAYGVQNNIALADGLADLSYVSEGTAVATGIDMEPVHAEVHRSNMSKFIDGHRDASGKWIKGPSYSPANLAPIIEAQSK